nr:hypothetical protein [Patescibacteria group bacterium]
EGKELANSSHAVVNGFANSWQILPDDVSGKDSYVLTVEFGLQRWFNFAFGLSMFVFGLCLIFLLHLHHKEKHAKV